jgi:hypothetical protein
MLMLTSAQLWRNENRFKRFRIILKVAVNNILNVYYIQKSIHIHREQVMVVMYPPSAHFPPSSATFFPLG